MQNKIFALLFVVFSVYAPNFARANDEFFDEIDIEENEVLDDVSDADVASARAVASYNVDGSVFQKITDLEQQKVLMELEKERAQLDLDLDRLAAEKIKLQMEMDTLSGRAEQEQQILQNEKSRLAAEAEKIERERQALMAQSFVDDDEPEQPKKATKKVKKEESDDIASKYKLVNVMGAGNQLQAALSDLETGQTKHVTVGKVIDGFTVKSISLEDGVVFSNPDGETQNLNISSR